MATKKTTDIRTELLTATGLKPKKNEAEAKLAERVASHISESMSEEDYDGLSKPAQKWYESVCKAMENGKDLPELPPAADAEEAPPAKKAAAKKTAKKAAEEEEEAEDDEEDEAEDDDEDDEEEEPAPKKGKKAAKAAPPAKKAAAKKEKAAPAKKAAAKKEPKEHTVSGSDYLRVLICKQPKLSLEQALEKMEGAGVELAASQAKGVYARTKRVVEIMLELGYTKSK